MLNVEVLNTLLNAIFQNESAKCWFCLQFQMFPFPLVCYILLAELFWNTCSCATILQ